MSLSIDDLTPDPGLAPKSSAPPPRRSASDWVKKSWPVLLWAANAAGAWLTGGVSSPLQFLFAPLIVLAGWVMGGAAGILFAVLSSLLGLAMMLMLPGQAARLAGIWLASSAAFMASGWAIFVIKGQVRSLRERASSSEQANRTAHEQMGMTRVAIQAQIAQQAQELERRNASLQASFEVNRAAATLLDPIELVRETVELIRQQFDLYYVGLFILDQAGEWAILQAGTGKAGEAMLRRQHRIRVGSGMVGWCIANSQPRISLDIQQDDVRLANPDLPETASEAAFPLRSRGRILGGLSVQSRNPQAFGSVEVSTFQSLADQLAIALDNASLIQEMQQTLERLQSSAKEAGRKAWDELIRQSRSGGLRSGYRYANHSLEPASGEWSPGMRQAVAEGQVVLEADLALAIPVRARGETIGVLRLAAPQAAGWEAEEVRLLENLAEQLGAALDSARLYQEAQRLAAREQKTAEVTAHLRESLDIDTILRRAVVEIARNLGGAEVLVTLGAPTQSETPDESSDLPEQPQESPEPQSIPEIEPMVQSK